tara:strand:- start:531 stop:776 length:246 start_codon:yes stop_codon:yes gene_type:complete
MSDVVTLAGAIGLFLMFGFAVNHFSESVYWWWSDRRAQKEDEKMLEDQEKTTENVADNVVSLDEVREKVTHYIDYGDDTIH